MNQPSTFEWPKNALPKKVVEWLFARMLSKWGKQFVDRWAIIDPDVLLIDWAKALHGLTELEFRRGVAKLDTFDWPPSQPEFLKACRPEVNPLTAYYEAIDGARSRERGEVGTWSHPAIFWASVRVSTFDLLSLSYSQIKARWEACLAAELEKGHWEPIPAPALMLPSYKKQLSREEAGRVLQELKTASGVQPVQTDPKGWAKKILQRHAKGDRSIGLIQLDFARKALGVKDDD
jgi:hypothetical protein